MNTNCIDWILDELGIDKDHPFVKEKLSKAKYLHKQEHGETWDSAIKAHDNRGHVHSRSWCDFDDYYYNKENEQC